MSDKCKHGVLKINVCTDCVREKFGTGESSFAAPTGSVSDRATNMCHWAAATLESALLGARKGDIEWALTKTLTAAKTLKRAKKLKAKTLNSDYATGVRIS